MSLADVHHGSHGGAMRYGRVIRKIPGVSQKMLTQTLRMPERDGMVAPASYDTRQTEQSDQTDR